MKMKLLLLIIIINIFFGCNLYIKKFATGGTTGKIKCYEFTNSKNEINQSLKNVLNKKQSLIPNSNYDKFMIHYYYDLNSKESKKINNDSIHYHCVIKNRFDDEFFLWFKFKGNEENWNESNCSLCLIEVLKNNKLQTDINIKSEAINLFENQVLNLINKELNNVPLDH